MILLRSEILGLQNPDDILVLEEGIVYLNKDKPPINSFVEGTVNAKQVGEEFISIVDRTSTVIPGELTITVVFKPLESSLPKRFNILATANNGKLTVELYNLSVSEIDKTSISNRTGYKGTTLTCYAEGIRVKETSR